MQPTTRARTQMAKSTAQMPLYQMYSKDFRSNRALLPDGVFLLSDGKRPGPTDLVREEVWNGIMHLPDDVAITTSNHHGTQLAALYKLWGDWLTAIGDEQDALFAGMLDAADCFQSSTFDLLHGYYRSAVSNLRSALELVAIGTLGNLVPNDKVYLRWKSSGASLAFPSCRPRLRSLTKEPISAMLFKQAGWMETFYYKLCDYAHSRPGSSDGDMWRSNGPIYVGFVANRVFQLQTSTYGACYVLAKVGRPKLILPTNSEFLFETSELFWLDDIASSFRTLSAAQG
jgi:hypothetical protein